MFKSLAKLSGKLLPQYENDEDEEKEKIGEKSKTSNRQPAIDFSRRSFKSRKEVKRTTHLKLTNSRGG